MSKEIDESFLETMSKEYYEREDREEYTKLINKKPLTKTDLERLLRWKSFHFGKIMDKITSPKTLNKSTN